MPQKLKKRKDNPQTKRRWFIILLLIISILVLLYLLYFKHETRVIKSTQPEGCEIDGTFYPQGKQNPNNKCLICNVNESTSFWSNNDGISCDDGVLCNGIDICEGGKCKVNAKDPCPDNGNYCDGKEYCDTKADKCSHTGNPCPDDTWCSNYTKRCENRECNKNDDCDDGIECTLDTCDLKNNICKHQPRDWMCDDGNACNGFEKCDSYGCTKPDAINSDKCFILK